MQHVHIGKRIVLTSGDTCMSYRFAAVSDWLTTVPVGLFSENNKGLMIHIWKTYTQFTDNWDRTNCDKKKAGPVPVRTQFHKTNRR
jgi:hypothetical protein